MEEQENMVIFILSLEDIRSLSLSLELKIHGFLSKEIIELRP